MDVVNTPLDDYNAVLYEWNDRLNLNLALLGTYFGETARAWLDTQIYETFQHVGAQLEQLYRELNAGRRDTDIAEQLEAELLALNDQIYRLGVFMMTQLRAGRVGRAAPQPSARADSPAAVPERGVPLVGIDEHERAHTK